MHNNVCEYIKTHIDDMYKHIYAYIIFLMKQNHCLTMKTGCPMTIPQRILLVAPFTPHQTTEQQRRSGRIIRVRHTRHHLCDVSAPTPLSSAQCQHIDEWKVGSPLTSTTKSLILYLNLKVILTITKATFLP